MVTQMNMSLQKWLCPYKNMCAHTKMYMVVQKIPTLSLTRMAGRVGGQQKGHPEPCRSTRSGSSHQLHTFNKHLSEILIILLCKYTNIRMLRTHNFK